jgi:hypothetical protein
MDLQYSHCHNIIFFFEINILSQIYSKLKNYETFIINARGGMIDHSQDASENVISVANESTVK